VAFSSLGALSTEVERDSAPKDGGRAKARPTRAHQGEGRGEAGAVPDPTSVDKAPRLLKATRAGVPTNHALMD
jgi:hypothetical protein